MRVDAIVESTMSDRITRISQPITISVRLAYRLIPITDYPKSEIALHDFASGAVSTPRAAESRTSRRYKSRVAADRPVPMNVHLRGARDARRGGLVDHLHHR